MSEQHREAVARRIRALLQKTIENGATEAEALTAAEMARKMMDAHRLTMTDVEIKSEEVVGENFERPYNNKLAPIDYCLWGIDAYCGTRHWLTSVYDSAKGRWVYRVRIFGLRSDVEMAGYLYRLCGGAIEREATTYAKLLVLAPGEDRRRENMSFKVGMAHRLNQRLHEMAKALEPVATTASGTALVVVKNQIVNSAYDALGLKFRGSSSGPQARSASGYRAGAAVGDRVNLNRPVGGYAQKSLG